MRKMLKTRRAKSLSSPRGSDFASQNREGFMDRFVLHSDFKPMGDQPQAIEALTKGFEEGNQFETLVGVTGSGKTFTMANIIQNVQKPTLIISTLSPIMIITSQRPMYLRVTLILRRIHLLMMKLIN